jgi:hypothetical protein
MSHKLSAALLGIALVFGLSALAGCGGASAPLPGDKGTPSPTPGALHPPAPVVGLQMPAASPVNIDFDNMDKSASAAYRIFFRDSVNEQSAGRWTVTDLGGAKAWTLSNTFFSPTKAWVVGQNYWNRENDSLLSNTFTTPMGEDGVAISFYARWNIAAGDNGTVYIWDGIGFQQVVNFTGGSNPNYPSWDKYYFKLPVNVLGVDWQILASFQSDTAVTGWGFGIDSVAVYQTQLGAVSDLAATDGTVAGQVDLTWSHNNTGTLTPDGYSIFRAADNNGVPGTFNLLNSVVYPAQNYSDMTGNADFYWYKVVATKATWPSGPDSNIDGGHGDGAWTALDADDIGDVGYYPTLIEANGRPGVAHYDNDTGDLLWSWSNMPDGSSSWNETVVDGALTNAGDFFNGAALVNGVPAISYYDATNTHLKYAYSSNAQGDATWTTLDVDTNPNEGQYSSLAVINGNPAISYYDQTNKLQYAYSDTVDGSSGWHVVTADGNAESGIYSALADINGFPAVAHFNGSTHVLSYTYSTQPDGSSGWNTVTVDFVGTTGLHPSLAEINGKPAISYWDNTNGDLRYAYSTTSDGSSGWNTLMVDGAAFIVGEGSSLTTVYGMPAIAYWDSENNDLRYATSTAVDGSSGWSSVLVDSTGFVGQYPSLFVMQDGSPAIAYRDNTNTNLRFAYFH